jgi:hypothetical protein
MVVRNERNAAAGRTAQGQRKFAKTRAARNVMVPVRRSSMPKLTLAASVSLTGLVLASVAIALSGCAPAEDERVAKSGHAIMGGVEVPQERPEVGRVFIKKGDALFLCTGTLVTPTIVITAAHCFDAPSREDILSAGHTFSIERDDGIFDFPIDRYRLKSPADIAIVHLAKPVPGAVATPAPLATASPVAGQPVTTFGYGCTDRGTQVGANVKRKVEYTFGGGSHVCFGDSGGPTFDAKGAVLAITEGFYQRSGIDALTAVAPLFRELTSDMIAWNADPCAGVAPTEVQYPAETYAAQGLCVATVFYCNPFQELGERIEQTVPAGYGDVTDGSCSFNGFSGSLPYMWQQNFCKRC